MIWADFIMRQSVDGKVGKFFPQGWDDYLYWQQTDKAI
jgi:hypothetical protein